MAVKDVVTSKRTEKRSVPPHRISARFWLPVGTIEVIKPQRLLRARVASGACLHLGHRLAEAHITVQIVLLALQEAEPGVRAPQTFPGLWTYSIVSRFYWLHPFTNGWRRLLGYLLFRIPALFSLAFACKCLVSIPIFHPFLGSLKYCSLCSCLSLVAPGSRNCDHVLDSSVPRFCMEVTFAGINGKHRALVMEVNSDMTLQLA